MTGASARFSCSSEPSGFARSIWYERPDARIELLERVLAVARRREAPRDEPLDVRVLGEHADAVLRGNGIEALASASGIQLAKRP
jgi:hypothetical protein